MITDCVETFSVRHDRDAGNVSDSKRIFYRKERTCCGKNRGEDIDRNAICTDSVKPFMSSCKRREIYGKRTEVLPNFDTP